MNNIAIYIFCGQIILYKLAGLCQEHPKHSPSSNSYDYLIIFKMDKQQRFYI